MKYIPLTQNKFALVDDRDYKKLIKFKWWYQSGYAGRSVKKKGRWVRYWMHRNILNTPLRLVTDHINGDKLDNRRQNLRICTQSQNNGNRSKHIKKTSIYKGVSFVKKSKKWYSQIVLNSKNVYIGEFKEEIDAAKAYNKKAKELFGDFARLNKV